MTYDEQKKINKKIVDFASKPENREKLLKNPKDTIKEHLNISIPDDVDIIINENKKNTYHFTLPDEDNNIRGSW